MTGHAHRGGRSLFIAVVGAPFVEELFFRGLLMSGLVSRFGVALGIIFQAIVFGLVHLSQADLNSDLGVFLLIAPVGAVLGVLRFGFKRLGTGMFTHATYNAIIIAVAARRASRTAADPRRMHTRRSGSRPWRVSSSTTGRELRPISSSASAREAEVRVQRRVPRRRR